MGVIYRNGTLYGGENTGNSGEVQADLNSIIVGDGDGWIKDNEVNFSIQNENGIATFVTPYWGASLRSSQGNSYLHSQDNGKLSIIGQSNVLIGENGTSHSRQFWGNEKKGPELYMEGTAIFQMLKGASSYSGMPTFQMKGDAYIDIEGYPSSVSSYSGRSGDYLSSNALDVYKFLVVSRSGNPFGNTSSIFPYVKLEGSSTIMMNGAPLLKMSDGSSLLTAGKCNVVFRGNYNADDRTSDGNRCGVTDFFIEPGSVVKIGGSPAFSSVFVLEPPVVDSRNGQIRDSQLGQIFLTSQASAETSITNLATPLRAVVGTNNQDALLSVSSSSELPRGLPIGSYSFSEPGSFLDYFANKIFAPTYLIQGRSRVVIGDQGYTNIRVCGQRGSVFNVDASIESNSFFHCKIGTNDNAKCQVDFTCDKTSITSWKIGAGENANSHFCYSPYSNSLTSFIFSPQGICGINFSPSNYTDIACQWKYFQGIFEGKNVFFQVEDYAHAEMWGNSNFIMRGPVVNQNGIKEMEWTNGHLNQSWYRPKQSNGGPTIQIYDSSDIIMRGYASFSNAYNSISIRIPFDENDSIDNYDSNYTRDKISTENISNLVNNYINLIKSYLIENHLCPGKENQNKQNEYQNWTNQQWIDYLNDENNSTELQLKYSEGYEQSFYFYINVIPQYYTSQIYRPAGNPLLELNHNTEIRLNNETYIKAERNDTVGDPNYGQMEFTIGGNGSGDEKVTFTAKQIKQLLNILSPITQETYDEMLENNEVEQGTPYFIV